MKSHPHLRWHYHAWIEYEELGRSRRAAEPDLFALLDNEIILVEFKLTGSVYGKAQCETLYAPLLHHIYSLPVRSLQVCKVLTEETPGPIVYGFDEFLNSSPPYSTLHWLGR